MEPLDLTHRPPRKATDALAGVIFMPRTIDKLRATLPGGSLGDYTIEGFTMRMLTELGVDLEDLRSLVALAQNDDDIAAWILKHTTPDARSRANEAVSSLTIGDRSECEGWFDRYPVARTLPRETPLIEMLGYDDAASFRDRDEALG